MVNERMNLYRIPFYERLRAELDRRDIDLQVVYGRGLRKGAELVMPPELSWGIHIESRVLRVGTRHLTWQSCMPLVRQADVVIVEQAAKRLLNYVLLARQLGGVGSVAFWGHGRNFQPTSGSDLAERIKRWVSRWPHWWFAYNDLSAAVVRDLGYPPERITSVQNAIDTRALIAAHERLDPAVVERTRQELGLTGRHVAIFCGGIYPEKRPHFMVSAAQAVRAKVPDFELLVIGEGISSEVLRHAAASHPWIHFLGAHFDEEKVRFFSLAKLSFLPGLVGLAVLDSFALEVPMVASRTAEHSPEIDYLQHDVNGFIVDDEGSPQRYADAFAALLTDDDHRRRLVEGCRADKERYTVEGMAQRFAAGIDAALRSPRRTPVPMLLRRLSR